MDTTADGQIVLRDTTLREGVQIPGSQISDEHKQRFVTLLDQVGVREVEVGLPDGASACADLVGFIHQRGLRIRPTGLVPCYTRTWRRQVDIAAERGMRIEVLAPASDHLLRMADHYGMTAEEIVPRLEEVISYARSTRVPAGAALIDTCRSPRERILSVARAADAIGADRLVIYDSVGTMLPWKMSELISAVRGATKIPILVHCHNDHGLATANTLAAIEAGACAADVAVNGLGGRAGNASLEEVTMALETICGRETGLDTRRLRELSAFVEDMTGVRNGPLKPVVGAWCFAHLPVMHVRCIAGGNAEAFEAFDPGLVGAQRTYGFGLPVDYGAALEPLARKAGVTIDARWLPALLETLRSRPLWTEVQAIQCLREYRPPSGPDAAGSMR